MAGRRRRRRRRRQGLGFQSQQLQKEEPAAAAAARPALHTKAAPVAGDSSGRDQPAMAPSCKSWLANEAGKQLLLVSRPAAAGSGAEGARAGNRRRRCLAPGESNYWSGAGS